MKTHPQTLRIAAVALFATAAFVNAPVYGQTAPVVAPPPPVQVAPPAPVAVTPPAVAPTPAPAPRAAPVEPRAAAPAPEPRQTARQAPRNVERATRTVSRTAPAPSPAAPAPEATAPAPAPVAETTPPPAAPAPAIEPVAPSGGVAVAESDNSTLTWLIAAGLALAIALAGLAFLRRRRAAEEDEYYYEETAYDEPSVVAEPEPVAERDYQPAIVTPAFRRAGPVPEAEVVAAATGIEIGEAEPADMEALAAGSAPEGHRPWLEFLMRPVRAGTTEDEALVEFELTVGNTGTVSAEDVRISTWMLSGEGSEAERSLVEPPAGATTSETRIAAGDGAKVDATIALPRARLRDDVLPVVVADARYRLPGGGEGRTSARFAVGLPSGDGLAPFAVALGEGLRDDVEVRLEGEPEHV